MTSDEILIEDFSSPTHTWKAKNDPVMGGRSTGTVTIKDGLGIFDGQVVDVPFLQAPGFITMETRGGVYPDVSSCQGFNINMRTTHPYDGYRISFGNVHVPGGRFAYGYKADFHAPLNDFATLFIPFSSFTAKWDDATGDAIVTCAEDSQYCPTRESLQNLQNIIFWAEGVASPHVHLEIASIAGAHCAADGSTLDETQNAMASSRSASMIETQGTMSNAASPSSSSWLTGPLAMLVVAALVGLVGRKLMQQYRKRSKYMTVEENSGEQNSVTLQV